MNKKFLFIFLSLVAFFSLAFAFSAHALEITSYPRIPMLPALDENSGISDFIGYIFGVLIYLAGFVSLISFVIGAIGLMNPNIAAHGDAKDRMKGAVLGLVLTMASVLILRTINPVFIAPTLTPLPGTMGVFYTNGSEDRAAPKEEADTTSIKNEGFNTLKYVCAENNSPGSSGSGGGTANATPPEILVWSYPEKNFSGIDRVEMKKLTCGGTVSVSGGSFQMEYKLPGVYYCLGGCSGEDMCQGYMSKQPLMNTDPDVSSPFENMKGILMVNDPASQTYYGAVLHQTPDLTQAGVCSKKPIVDTGGDAKCEGVDFQVGAVDIFRVNMTPQTSGTGLVFYSEPNGKGTISNAGKYSVTEIKSEPEPLDPLDMAFDYSETTRHDYYKLEECPTFQHCPGSVYIKGNYLLQLVDEDDICQTFTQDVVNLLVQPFGKLSGGVKFDIYIVPTQ